MLRRHIPTLDGWRAIAILLVIWAHFGASQAAESGPYWSNAVSRFGVSGVPVFFAISGLLITKLLLEERDRTGGISLKAFYVRRGFRILPPLLVLLAVVGLLGWIETPLEIASSVFFFRNYVPPQLASIFTEHLWSLSVEEHFYLMWPAMLVFMVKRGWSARGMFVLSAGIGTGLALWRVVELKMGLVARVAPVLAGPMRTDFRLDGIFFGCAAAFVLHDEALRARAQKWLSSPVVLVAIAAAVAVNVIPNVKLSALWFSALIPVALLGTILNPGSVLGSILESRVAQWIGQISYSLYLWQQVFLVPGWHVKPLGALQSAPLQLVVLFAAAYLSFRLVEQPMIAAGKRVLTQMRRKPLEALEGVERV